MSTRTVSSSRFLVRDFGTCLNFNGTSAEVDIGTMSSFGSNMSSGVSVSCWFKSTSTALKSIAGFFNTGTTTALDIRINCSGGTLFVGKIEVYLRDESNKALQKKTSSAYGFNDNRWHNLTVTLLGSTNAVHIYLDGNDLSLDTDNAQTPVSFVNLGFSMKIGARNARGVIGQYFSGNLDEVLFYNKVLTSTEATDLYYKGIIPSSAVSYYKFNEGSGATATDSAGANTGTITAATYSTDVFLKPRSAATNRFLVARTTQKSLSFNGSSDYATVPIVPDPTGFNFSGFFRITTNRTNGGLVQYQNGTTGGFKFSTEASIPTFAMFDTGATTINIAPKKIQLGNWNHFVIIFAPNNFNFYINNILVATDTSCSMNTAAGKTLTLFRNNDVGSGYVSGNLKNFTFQNTTTPWTTQQISDLYYRNIIPSGAIQYSMNNTNLDQNGANGLTLTGTSYVIDVPIQNRSTV